MCGCVACISVCEPHVCLVPVKVRRGCELDPLRLELQKVVTHHGDARNQPQPRSSGRAASALNP